MAAVGVSERFSAGKGKGLFADVRFNKGDIILTEKPLACCQFSWNKAYKYRACEYCMRSLETAEEMCRRLAGDESIELPHKECCPVDKSEHVICNLCKAEYCSSHCKTKAAEEYHGTICLEDANPIKKELETLDEMWRQIHYPPETSSIMLIVRMIALVKQSSNRGTLLKTLNSFCNRTSDEHNKIIHKLVGNKFHDQIDALRLQLKSTIREDRLEAWYTADGFRSLLAMLGTNQQGIGSSSVSIWVKNCEKLCMSDADRIEFDLFADDLYTKIIGNAGEFLDCDGVGLYALQSCCNHSCRPNAEVAFEHGDNKLTLRAINAIDEGDEILISYMCEGELTRSRHSRQKFLSENYLFVCNCSKCDEQMQDLDLTSDEDTTDDSCENFSECSASCDDD